MSFPSSGLILETNWGAVLLISAVAIQRIGELILSQRNTKALLAKGAYEVGSTHYPAIVLVHTTWLISILIAGIGQPLHLGWLLLFAVVQFLRVWVLKSLGPRWTTRIIVLPDAPLVRDGPYRFRRHPNYLIVAIEIFALPMALGLFELAVVFSLVNAGVLYLRIHLETKALREAAPRECR